MTTKQSLALAEQLHSVACRSRAEPSAKVHAFAAVFANFGVEILSSMGRTPDEIEIELTEIVKAVLKVKLRQLEVD